MMMLKQLAKRCYKQGLSLRLVPLDKPFDLPKPACLSSVTIPPGVLVNYPSDLQASLDALLACRLKEKALVTSELTSSQQLDSTYDTSFPVLKTEEQPDTIEDTELSEPDEFNVFERATSSSQ